MKKKKDSKPIINRIEIDENTAEPIIVEVPESELDRLAKESSDNVEIQKADFLEKHQSAKSAGKQIVMSRLGISKTEKENITKRQRIFKTIITLVFIVFVVGVLGFTFYNDFFSGNNQAFPSIETIAKTFVASWQYAVYALIALFLCYLFKALKLTILCKPLTGKFHFKTCFETGIIGHYMNFVTPLAVGGQPFEIYHLSKHGVHGGVAAALPIATYVLNQFAYVILGFTFILMFKYNTLNIMNVDLLNAVSVVYVLAIIGLSFCFLMPFLIILFCLMPRFGAKIVHFVMFIGGKLRIIKDPKKTTYKTIKNVIHNAQCLKKIFSKPFTAIICFILSFLEHFAFASLAYLCLKLFGYNNSAVFDIKEWLQIIQLVTILNLAVSFVPTPGNAGASDLCFYLLFSSTVLAGFGFIAMLSWRMLSFYAFIIIGFIFASIKKRADRKHNNLESEI